jgi:hypothetical protein
MSFSFDKGSGEQGSPELQDLADIQILSFAPANPFASPALKTAEKQIGQRIVKN